MQPFQWDFPYLSAKIANNSRKTILLSELKLDIQDSILDNRPIIVVRGSTYQGEAVLTTKVGGRL